MLRKLFVRTGKPQEEVVTVLKKSKTQALVKLVIKVGDSFDTFFKIIKASSVIVFVLLITQNCSGNNATTTAMLKPIDIHVVFNNSKSAEPDFELYRTFAKKMIGSVREGIDNLSISSFDGNGAIDISEIDNPNVHADKLDKFLKTKIKVDPDAVYTTHEYVFENIQNIEMTSERNTLIAIATDGYNENKGLIFSKDAKKWKAFHDFVNKTDNLLVAFAFLNPKIKKEYTKEFGDLKKDKKFLILANDELSENHANSVAMKLLESVRNIGSDVVESNTKQITKSEGGLQ